MKLNFRIALTASLMMTQVAFGVCTLHISMLNSRIETEVQVRGHLIQKAADVSHIFYDIRKGKKLNPLLQNKPGIVEAANAYELLTPQRKLIYDAYINENFLHARRLEMGKPTVLPSFPKNLPEILRFETIEKNLAHE